VRRIANRGAGNHELGLGTSHNIKITQDFNAVKIFAKSDTAVRLERMIMFADAQLNQFIIFGLIASLVIIFLDGLRKSANRKNYMIGLIQSIGIIIVVGFVIPWTVWNFIPR
jgi:hypothetical protein